MYYLRARYFRPQVGRFLTLDTYPGDDKQPTTKNLYVYAAVEPVELMDPSGHTFQSLALRFPAIAGAVAVIGRRADLLSFECNAAYNTVVRAAAQVGETWSRNFNDQWVQTIINNRQVVFMVSDPNLVRNIFGNPAYNNGYTVFWSELQVLCTMGMFRSGPI